MPRKLPNVLMYADHAWFDLNKNTDDIREHLNDNKLDGCCYLTLCTASHDIACTTLSASLGGAILEGAGWSVLSTNQVALAGTLGAATFLAPLTALCYFFSAEKMLNERQKLSEQDKFMRVLNQSVGLSLTALIGASVNGMSGAQLGYAAASGAIGGAAVMLTGLALITIGKAVYVKCCTNTDESFIVNYSNSGQTSITPASLQRAIDKNGFVSNEQFIQHLRTEAETKGIDPLDMLSAFLKAEEKQAATVNSITVPLMK